MPTDDTHSNLGAKIDIIGSRLEERFEQLGTRFDEVNKRLDALVSADKDLRDELKSDVKAAYSKINSASTSISQELSSMKTQHDERIRQLELDTVRAVTRDDHERRLRSLEITQASSGQRVTMLVAVLGGAAGIIGAAIVGLLLAGKFVTSESNRPHSSQSTSP